MDKKFSFSGIASNPASGINNIDLNVAGADGAGMSSDSSGVTKKEMIALLQKIVHAENGTIVELKSDLEEIIERITRPEYKKRVSQIGSSRVLLKGYQFLLKYLAAIRNDIHL